VKARVATTRSSVCRWALAVWPFLPISAAAALFLVAGLRATHGVWPAPLDDVYIHYDFAKSAASGHPFSWIAGNGYSSGGTSLLYPLILAVGFISGLHGSNLGAFAALVAILSLVDLSRSIASLSPRPSLAIAAPIALMAVPLLDWTWFSGMEVAFAAALLGRAIRSAHRAAIAPPQIRARAQLAAGVYLALLAVSRPECAVLAPLLAVSIARQAGALSGLSSALRAIVPTALALSAQAAANLALTGEMAAAGALRKLVTENPYASSADIAVVVLKNFAELRTGGVDVPLGGRVGSGAIHLLALAGVLDRRRRAIALPLVIGAYATLALACLNVTAPFQNMRYATPTLAMLVVAALVGFDALVRHGPLTLAAAAMLGFGFLITAPRSFPQQVDYFARASGNIVHQQVEVGRRLAALPERPRRVFVGDAGAIPFVSGIAALDGLGLGGYRGLPFARASVAGTPAVIELIERMPPEERPDILAIYDSWWPGVGSTFGERMFDVHLDDNVICGDPTKSVYRAEWSLLEDRRGTFEDRLDIGDIVDEREHAYAMPHPHAGYVIASILEDPHGQKRYDAGRLIPQGMNESFVVRGNFARGERVLVIRTDDKESRQILVTVAGEATPFPASLEASDGIKWSETRVVIEKLGPGDRVSVRAEDGALRSFAYVVE
jgi:hypothetical protein